MEDSSITEFPSLYNCSISAFFSTMTSELPTKEEGMNVHGSMLNRHDDPFAPREGKTLIWKDVNMTLVRAYTTSSSSILLRLLDV
jgi:hypothetical protein